MLILNARELTDLLPRAAVVASVERALKALHAGEVQLPPRQHLNCGAMTLLTMPAAAHNGAGVKMVSVAPGNAALGLPVVNGAMLVIDAKTGVPAALLNAAALTAQRTGAIGAVGIKYTTPADIASVGIIGVGVQAAWQAIYAAAVRPIDTVFYIPRAQVATRTFEQRVRQFAPQVALHACRDVNDLLQRAALIIAATTSPTPVLPNAPVSLDGKHFISVGSFTPAMQELPDCVYRLAGFVAYDSDQAREEVGDIAGPLSRAVVAAAQAFHIAETVAGYRPIDVTRTTAFKSVGAALYDIFAAQAYVEAARACGVGTEIAL